MDLGEPGVSVPCFSRLPEDGKGPMADRAESFLTMDRRLAGDKGAFFVQARARESAALGCLEGDYILLQPAALADLPDGSIVAVKLDGQAGYYRFTRNEAGARIHPLQGKAPSVSVDDQTGMVFLGRVTGLYRRLDHLPAAVTTVAH
jgi:SOS-response transcriptional repressor LexA